jgi:hypothetical protein
MIDGRIPYKYRKFDNYIEIAGNKIWLINPYLGKNSDGVLPEVLNKMMEISGKTINQLNAMRQDDFLVLRIRAEEELEQSEKPEQWH